MPMKSILVLGVALCLAACGSGPDTYKKAGTFDFASFPDTKTLQGKALPIRDLANPVQLLVRDSLLLVADRNTDFLLSVYDVSTGRRKGEFLPRGKGPEEALHIRHIADRGDAFWVNDFPQRKIYTYRFSGLDSMENLRPDVVIAPAESPDDVFRLKDGVWLGRTDESPDPDSGNCRLLVFDESGRVLHRFAPCPDGGPAVDRLALYRAYEFRPVPKSDDGSRIALFHKTTDLIELYDAEGRLLKRLHGPECFFSGRNPAGTGRYGPSVVCSGRSPAGLHESGGAGRKTVGVLQRRADGRIRLVSPLAGFRLGFESGSALYASGERAGIRCRSVPARALYLDPSGSGTGNNGLSVLRFFSETKDEQRSLKSGSVVHSLKTHPNRFCRILESGNHLNRRWQLFYVIVVRCGI